MINTAEFNQSDARELFGFTATALPETWHSVGVSTDTRTLAAGNLFVALVGERFDGHTLVAEAAQKGAAGAIVGESMENSIKSSINAPADFPLIIVPNTIHALGALANHHRERFEIPVIAIAGAAGKTTTKDMIAHVLAHGFGEDAVLKTEGNYNNQIGVPMTLLRLTAAHSVAVIEIGTNEPGEIEILSRITAPTHGIITNIGKEHLEKLINLDGVEHEETALFRYLEDVGGTAFINVDDDRLRKYSSYVQSMFTYSLSRNVARKADLTASAALAPSGEATLSMIYKVGTRHAKAAKADALLRVVGLPMAQNALAAAAVGCALGMDLSVTAMALHKFMPAASDAGYGRMVVEQLLWKQGVVTLLNDCYNANPLSMYAALDTLRSITPQGKRIAVLGAMRELGGTASEEHGALVEFLSADAALAHVLVLGDEMREACEAHGFKDSATITICENKEVCIAALRDRLNAGDVLLVKGSRSVNLEEIVKALHS
jgi:UDP-N-acetylmuramoyl-tripeptide--D-alanyl-D-alanine ligase